MIIDGGGGWGVYLSIFFRVGQVQLLQLSQRHAVDPEFTKHKARNGTRLLEIAIKSVTH